MLDCSVFQSFFILCCPLSFSCSSACTTRSCLSGQLHTCIFSYHEQNDIKTSCTLSLVLCESWLFWEMLQLHWCCTDFNFYFYNQVCIPLPVSSTLIWSQSSAFSFVLDNECSWWTATALLLWVEKNYNFHTSHRAPFITRSFLQCFWACRCFQVSYYLSG